MSEHEDELRRRDEMKNLVAQAEDWSDHQIEEKVQVAKYILEITRWKLFRQIESQNSEQSMTHFQFSKF